MMDNGKTILNMARDLITFQMEINMKEIGKMESWMELEHIVTKIRMFILGNIKITLDKAMEYINMQMEICKFQYNLVIKENTKMD